MDSRDPRHPIEGLNAVSAQRFPGYTRQETSLRRRTFLLSAGIGSLLMLGACGQNSGALDPRGPAASDIADHWWLMFWLGVAVYVVVVAVLVFAIIRARSNATPDSPPPISDGSFFLVAGLAIPAVILVVLLTDSVRTGQAVINPPEEPALTIEVIGHQFWWEVRYLEHDVVTANEIHIPVGVPVELTLRSADVIHSFWVPELAGKRDLNPMKENVTWIQADEEGTYWGQCAEFCGIQHALMGKLVIAQSMDEFEEWIEARQQPATEPDDELLHAGMEVYFDAGCAMCHAIEGITEPLAAGSPGPDLTHFGSRRTLASGIEENTYGNLAAWIVNPHEIKPGVRMPPTDLDPEEIEALVEFLLSLE
jgi:cytochrome c oxidase subunit II